MLCAGFLFLIPFVLLCIFLLLQQQFRFSPSTTADAIAIVRCVDVRELEDLLDRAKEESLRAGMSAARFHESQQARARLLFEYLRRIGFNAIELLVWAYAEEERLQGPGMPEDQEQGQNIRNIIDAGTDSRLYFAVALSVLSLHLLLDELRIVRIRSLSRLRHAAGIDGLDSYRRLAQAAVALIASRGADATRLAVLLRGSGSIS